MSKSEIATLGIRLSDQRVLRVNSVTTYRKKVLLLHSFHFACQCF